MNTLCTTHEAGACYEGCPDSYSYTDEITFYTEDADGPKAHVAVVREPTSRPPLNYMMREVDGVEYQIYVLLDGGFAARPIECGSNV